MSKVLNSLIISDGLEVQAAIEAVMAGNLEGYVLSFLTLPLAKLPEIDREPDLIFIENKGALTAEEAARIVNLFPRKTTVVLDEHSDRDRREFLKAGVDEVMSLAELQSALGRHLIKKLLAFRDLAAAEARLEQNEARFRGIIEHSHDIITLLDADASIGYMSPAFRRQLNYEEWEVLGQSFFDFVQEDDRDYFEDQLKKLLSETMAGPFDFRFRRSDGAWRVFEAMATNLLDDEVVQALVLNIRDVTEQKEAERELEKHRLHLEELVETRTREAQEVRQQADTVIAASPDALIAMDSCGVITFISRHYHQMYPKSAAVLQVDRHISEAYDAVADELSLPAADPRRAEMREWWLKPEGAKEFRSPNGVWVRLKAKKMQDGSGGIVVSSTNITDYKRQQALLAQQSFELISALKKEKNIVEQQRTFVSMVSHEFRTPLTIIDGNAQIIERRGDTIGREFLKKRASTIRVAVDRLVRLIETVLSAHMLEAGKLELHTAPCDLEKIIRDVVSDQQDISPRHSIRADIQALPKAIMLDDKVIRQAVANLLSNAVKYSPASDKIEVAAFATENEVMIEVKDYGVGIPAHEMPKIFTKYFRASTSSGIPGSGLGLSLVKQFIELHNGTIVLQSEVGVGTVVTIALPAS